MSSVVLPVITLPPPLVLLPTARVTLLVSRSVGDSLLTLLEESGSQIVAAVPIVSPPTESSDPIVSDWGVAGRILRLGRSNSNDPNQAYYITIVGLGRLRLKHTLHVKSTDLNSVMHCPIEYSPSDSVPSSAAVTAFKVAALNLLDNLGKSGPKKQQWARLAGFIEDVSEQKAAWMADAMVSMVDGDFNDKLEILSTPEIELRLKRTTDLFVKLATISEVSTKIASDVDENLSKQQKEFFLRQQLAAIQKELQSLNKPRGGPGTDLDDDDQTDADDMTDLKRKIEAMEEGSEERKMGGTEWRRLKRIPQGSVENGVIRSYLDWLTSLPWPSTAISGDISLETLQDRQFLAKARQQLESDHYGLEKIKKRLIEYLAVVRLKELAAAEACTSTPSVNSERSLAIRSQTADPTIPTHHFPKVQGKRAVKGPILLFVGPPGTGKTSISSSLARALGRPFQRVSLGGVRDEAEIRGHRRTYVASGPGAIIQAMRKAGRPDPVLLLDEIDKVGHNNFHGDPSAALLEVLDPEQNHAFRDHYINVPFDLSQVLFICTANTLETISAPLLDRCQVIHLSGYTYDEKLHIAKRFLLPKQLTANGLDASNFNITESALLSIATDYTREAGVRSLERAIGAVVRYKAVQWAESFDQEDSRAARNAYIKEVAEGELEKILGIPRWDGGEKEREEKRGVVYGLVVSGLGEGGILPVETCTIPGKGELKLTGSLGEVIKESSSLSLSWLKTHAYDLYITSSRGQDPCKVPDLVDIHLHLPAGAQKKDGPSAGIAMVCALVSLFTGACVPSNIAMTGEITLRGRVDPVGGIKEKVLGAHRANITKVILPYANRKDVEHDVPLEVKNAMVFVYAKTVEEALEAAFGRGVLKWRRRTDMMIESRL